MELHHGVSRAFFLGPAPRGYDRAAYFGTLWSALDYAAISALAESGVEVLMIGPVKEPPPRSTTLGGRRGAVAHADLPGLLSDRTVLLLPYAATAYNEGVAPAKLYECLATGRPVLSSPLPSLAEIRVLDFCRTPAEWRDAIRALPALEADGQRRAARVALAAAHDEAAAFARLEKELAA